MIQKIISHKKKKKKKAAASFQAFLRILSRNGMRPLGTRGKNNNNNKRKRLLTSPPPPIRQTGHTGSYYWHLLTRHPPSPLPSSASPSQSERFRGGQKNKKGSISPDALSHYNLISPVDNNLDLSRFVCFATELYQSGAATVSAGMRCSESIRRPLKYRARACSTLTHTHTHSLIHTHIIIV